MNGMGGSDLLGGELSPDKFELFALLGFNHYLRTSVSSYRHR